MGKKFFLNTIFLIVSFLFTLFLLEIGIRFNIKIKSDKRGIDRIEHYSRSWPLFKSVKGKKYYFELIPSSKKKLDGFVYQVNDKGLRDNKNNFFRDPKAYHILIIGDSMTFGVGVNYEYTYASILENKLNDYFRIKGKKFQVWNGGVPAYSLEQIAGSFEQKSIFLNPDMVILGFFKDDFVRPSWYYKGGILYDPAKNFWVQKLFAKSRLLSSILFRYEHQKYNPYYYYGEYYLKVDQRWNNAMQNVETIHNICKKNGLQLLVLDLPTLFWKGHLKKEETKEYPFNLKLEAFCKKNGIAYKNGLFVFEGLEAKSLWAIPDYDCHYNKKANQLVAESIFKTFLDTNIFQNKNY